MSIFYHGYGHWFRRATAIGSIVVWSASIALGFGALHLYEITPGPSGPSLGAWPATAAIQPVLGKINLVMAVHPRCPCTRASLAMLGEIVKNPKIEAAVRLLVYRPERSDADWAGSSCRAALSAIPNSERVDDPGGKFAESFGLATSGATVVFDATGQKQFQGGLTSATGRLELSAGGADVLAILAGRPTSQPTAKVFGCALRSSTNRSEMP